MVVPFLMGHLRLRRWRWLEDSTGLGAQVVLVMEQGWGVGDTLTESERDREHGSDGDPEICVGRQKRNLSPPILGGGMLTTYLGSLSRAVLESREGAQAVSPRINHSPGHIVGPSVIWRPVTLLLLLPWIQQPGWSKTQTAGEAGTEGVHRAGLGASGNTKWAAHSLGVPR